ncbi:MAG: isoprenylcysteine carboxylmethyltransferase family protein [Anaerolineales bacterium]|nr:isoprenylcysteine carboxylmethyltransferase family protein [Anaerolineales bacterium]HMS00291.1 isoprenylcysteine carboxylmethyltransferase family protein [Anaerolineales bacterium]
MNTIKTILYMGFMHGLFTVYLPFQLASRDTPFVSFGLLAYLAFLFWIVGALIIIRCSVDIINRGRGTPAHVDPPKELVIAGLYRYVRNPIYVGAMLFQVGYILWFGSALGIAYALLFFLGFNGLIFIVEEPILRNQFGAAYEEYCQRVPRWIPRFISSSTQAHKTEASPPSQGHVDDDARP